MLSALLEFIYAGEVTVDESHVETLLKVLLGARSSFKLWGLSGISGPKMETMTLERLSSKSNLSCKSCFQSKC